MSEADIEALQAQDREALEQSVADVDFEVHPDNWDSWLFFLTVQTQWLYAASAMGAQRVGLSYAGVESGARMSGRPRHRWPALLADLKVIEVAVLQADAEMADASR